MKCILIMLYLTAVSAYSQPDQNFDLYLLIGQSNMAGRGEITPDLKEEGNQRVYMLDRQNKWVPARHPLHFDKPIAGVGPGLGFGIAMAEANPLKKIGLIPCAVGGTAIEYWQPGAYDSATKTNPYDDAVLRIQSAMRTGVIRGIIWHQGEADSSPEKARLYLDKLSTLIHRLRQITNLQTPFIAGELGHFRPNYLMINDQLSLLPAKVPLTDFVSSKGLSHKGDSTHFDSKSAQELGRRYASRMVGLEEKR